MVRAKPGVTWGLPVLQKKCPLLSPPSKPALLSASGRLLFKPLCFLRQKLGGFNVKIDRERRRQKDWDYSSDFLTLLF